MEIVFTLSAQKDYDFWKKTNEKKVERIKALMNDILKQPFTGI